MAENNDGKLFFNFLNFFAIYFRNLLPRVEYERNSGLKLFYLFLGLSHPISSPFWLKITPESGFFNFFAIFFRNLLPFVEYERNSGLKFFYLFLGLSHPVLAKNNARKLFFKFLNFFAFSFGIFSPGSSINGIRV